MLNKKKHALLLPLLVLCLVIPGVCIFSGAREIGAEEARQKSLDTLQTAKNIITEYGGLLIPSEEEILSRIEQRHFPADDVFSTTSRMALVESLVRHPSLDNPSSDTPIFKKHIFFDDALPDRQIVFTQILFDRGINDYLDFLKAVGLKGEPFEVNCYMVYIPASAAKLLEGTSTTTTTETRIPITTAVHVLNANVGFDMTLDRTLEHFTVPVLPPIKRERNAYIFEDRTFSGQRLLREVAQRWNVSVEKRVSSVRCLYIYDPLTRNMEDAFEKISEIHAKIRREQEWLDHFPGYEPSGPLTQESQTSFKDDPDAHLLYENMIDALRNAESLYYESTYESLFNNKGFSGPSYKIWMKKPNYVRLEGYSHGKPTGVLVGDGKYFWIYWHDGLPEYWKDKTENFEEIRYIAYMKKRAPQGMHSIGHEIGNLNSGIGMTIIDPSTFHGYTDSLQPYLDGVRKEGVETVDDEMCDIIEVSFMGNQRSWYLWLSRNDHLPRKLKQIVRVGSDIVMQETWHNIALNCNIGFEKFQWSPPEGWVEWRRPGLETGLLAKGARAPDFSLDSIDGNKISLADYQGKIVWLYIWRCG